MDIADTAQSVIELELSIALSKKANFSSPSLKTCIDCDDDIPKERQKIGAITRCVSCQGIHERRTSMYRVQ